MSGRPQGVAPTGRIHNIIVGDGAPVPVPHAYGQLCSNAQSSSIRIAYTCSEPYLVLTMGDYVDTEKLERIKNERSVGPKIYGKNAKVTRFIPAGARDFSQWGDARYALFDALSAFC